ncbi:MAG: 3,4-dihydroxy-2-butanone-4-phosphate synthase [Pseudomonadota bacterium]
MSEDLSTAVYAEGRGFISPTDEIIDDLRNGRMVILADAEDRENEGDLFIPAQMATPDAINFMAKHGRGLICLSLTEQRASDLQLSSMVASNDSRTGTAFTVSIEARDGVTTGISAHDRARTISVAIDASAEAGSIVSPGHVFPLVARDGGVLVRAGHTEASVDLARLAGLNPSAVICEIMNDDGTMARMPDLVRFAQTHGLKVGTIEDLIAFRLRNDRIVRPVTVRDVTTSAGGAFVLHVYETTTDPVEHLALVKGDLSEPGPVLTRVHAVNPLTDLLGVGDGPQDTIAQSMRAIEAAGRGVIVLIRDLRPKSVSESFLRKAEANVRKIQGHESRNVEIGIGSQILRDLGVTEMEILTNSPDATYVGLEAFGLKIAAMRPLGES